MGVAKHLAAPPETLGVMLSGSSLTLERLAAVARNGAQVELDAMRR